MEKKALDAYTDEARHEIFSRINIPYSDVHDLEGFENFVYRIDNRIVRVTHCSHRTRHQLMGELEFLNWLALNGAPVSQPLELPGHDLLLSVGEFHVCLFEAAPGKAPDGSGPFTPDLIREWGRSMGIFHRLSADFRPEFLRQDWRDDENHDFRARIAVSEMAVIEAGEKLLADLEVLPANNHVYGLIHSDAHTGNFFADDNRLTFFDFDDCLNTWFGYDLGTVLFGAGLHSWVKDDDKTRTAVVERFLVHFLEGYGEKNDIASLMLAQMSQFIALREFSQYAVIHAHMDPENPEPGMPAKFIHDFRRRFGDRKPYVDIDFLKFG